MMLSKKNERISLGAFLLFTTAILMALYVVHYLTGFLPKVDSFLPRATNFISRKGTLAHDQVWSTFFRFHIVGGAIGIVSGGGQFFPSFRSRYPSFHRWLGMSYACAILVSSIAGLYLCWFASVSTPGIIGFYITNMGWLGSTLLAIHAVTQKDICNHRKWFIRSYAFTMVVVTFRLFYQILFGLLGYSFDHAYVLSIWLSVPFNMIVADYFLIARYKI